MFVEDNIHRIDTLKRMLAIGKSNWNRKEEGGFSSFI